MYNGHKIAVVILNVQRLAFVQPGRAASPESKRLRITGQDAVPRNQ